MQILSGNETLYSYYQAELIKLEAIEGGIPSELLPTEAELMQELANTHERININSEFRGDFKGNPKERDVFTNICIPVLQTPEAAKKLSFIERVKNFLQGK